MIRPTFSAKFLRDGSTAFRCVQTGVRYIVAQAGSDHATYREGRMIFTGPRSAAVNAVESDAKWGFAQQFLDRHHQALDAFPSVRG